MRQRALRFYLAPGLQTLPFSVRPAFPVMNSSCFSSKIARGGVCSNAYELTKVELKIGVNRRITSGFIPVSPITDRKMTPEKYVHVTVPAFAGA